MILFLSRPYDSGPSGTNAGDIDVGTEVILNENGQPVNYLIVNQGIPENSLLYDASCEGTWLLRKDLKEPVVWNSNGVSTLPDSTIMTTMAGYVDDYDPAVQEAVKTVKIPYCVGNGSATVNSGTNGLECKIFPLGGYEVGFTTSDNQYFPIDGAKLAYFDVGTGSTANNKRIAKLNGSATLWWLRSPFTYGPINVWYVGSNGYYYYWVVSAAFSIRPALILPYDFKFKDDQIVA